MYSLITNPIKCSVKYSIKDLKKHLKILATQIRELKNKRKGSPYGRVPGLEGLRYDYRHYHIAYCLFRGRTIEQIEPNYDPINNPRNMAIVNSFLKDLNTYYEELENAA